ncbi:cytochrome P450 monooxygenase 54 [Heterobasidion irregulare TC 32-1]|uniref:Cytochrome P450 monooxygenase 54 n=1 Tax=Heterobasidion irregulare (strain TC 32-1) TaxID=747525 RepID=W4KDW5_HETIT|nr:cytochrome P450 monooxygenase 54 [Heterobasidion irregulare TC 32-1]ETW83998.1 cytochrome P450 monooxygenase 54 [Heterobasidion irregulare TC 32-1]
MTMLAVQFAAGLFAACGTALVWKLVVRWVKQAPLRNIPGPPSKSLWSGNMGEVFDLRGWKFHADIAAKYGRIVKLNGILGDAFLYVSDTRALYQILIKDQYTFEEPSEVIEMNKLVFGPGLVSALGEDHKRQRKLLTPVFSSSHMRYMTPIFDRIAHQVENEKGRAEIDMMDWMTRAALEIIGQGGLGYSFDSMDVNAKNVYANATKNLLPTVTSPKMMIAGQFLPWAVKVGNAAFRKFAAKYIPWKEWQNLVGIVDVMDRTSRHVFDSKKRALEMGDEAVLKQVGEGKDLTSILLKANMDVAEEDRLPESELVAQMNTLIFAAMDTTSSALSRILQLLTENPSVQDKLRAELTEATANGDLNYDSLNALPYLEAVVRETLRLHPPAVSVNRTCRKDTMLQLGTPIIGVDGKKMSEIFVPNNTSIIISILSVNRDPGIWGPDVMEWKPERWLAPLPSSVTDAHIPGVYANTLTFLGGGRACIGFKFSQLEMKVILAALLPAFQFAPSKKHISWTMGGVSGPVVEGSSQPTMPLVLTLVKGKNGV